MRGLLRVWTATATGKYRVCITVSIKNENSKIIGKIKIYPELNHHLWTQQSINKLLIIISKISVTP